ncbi:MAG: tRNA epoxyqueuosine(34) reductase QueG [Armatimonadota bacterium]|nr:tRNA epoxyqueuosine(34) reductase QueG [Armatimonadota bacterium]
MSTLLAQRIKGEAVRLGFDRVGIAPAEPGPHSAFLDEWLARGFHAEMGYLARDPDTRKDPRRLFPGARSAVVCTLGYYPGTEPACAGDPRRAVIARYARSRDYHYVVREKLAALLAFVRSEAGAEVEGSAYVDTAPLLERELAAQAGVGQFGKNTLLIAPGLGSYFFIGVLLLALPLPSDAPASRNLCGACTRCLNACPTGAIVAPYQLDARRCLAYLTIENRGAIPPEFRPALRNRVFGCDICQEVCPWNRRAPASRLDTLPTCDFPLLTDLLHLDQEEFARRFGHTPVSRAKCRGLRRTAAVALGNYPHPDSVSALAAALSDPEPLVRAHAAWALGRVGLPQARQALEAALPGETDPAARQEILAALSG